MFPPNRHAQFIVALVLAPLAFSRPVSAAPKSAPLANLAVDAVRLKSGKTMRGIVVHIASDGTRTMAVSREWLEHADPDEFQKLTKVEAATSRQAWQQLRDRLKQAIAATDEQALSFRLKSELERVEKLLAEPGSAEVPQFLWVDLQKKTIADTSSASDDRLRVAAWAYSERLPNVETRDADDLSAELKKVGVDASVQPPDLSDRFPPRLQDDREWAARLALAAYSVGEPLDFQGTGDMLVEAKASRDEKDLLPVIEKLLSQQVGSLVNELLGEAAAKGQKDSNPDAWLKPAIREAEQKKAKAFRATRLDMNRERLRATVQSVFVVQVDGGEWETIWSTTHNEDASKERADVETRIMNDPQVKSAIDTLKPLGLADDAQFQQAIRFGAATMAAQQAAKTKFAAFRDSMLKRLDGPPLWWEASQREVQLPPAKNSSNNPGVKPKTRRRR